MPGIVVSEVVVADQLELGDFPKAVILEGAPQGMSVGDDVLVQKCLQSTREALLLGQERIEAYTNKGGEGHSGLATNRRFGINVFDEMSSTAAGAHEHEPESQIRFGTWQIAQIAPRTAEAVEWVDSVIVSDNHHLDALIDCYNHGWWACGASLATKQVQVGRDPADLTLEVGIGCIDVMPEGFLILFLIKQISGCLAEQVLGLQGGICEEVVVLLVLTGV